MSSMRWSYTIMIWRLLWLPILPITTIIGPMYGAVGRISKRRLPIIRRLSSLVYIYLGQNDEGIADLSKAGELGVVSAYNIIKRLSDWVLTAGRKNLLLIGYIPLWGTMSFRKALPWRISCQLLVHAERSEASPSKWAYYMRSLTYVRDDIAVILNGA